MKTKVMLVALLCAVLSGCGSSSGDGDATDPSALLNASNQSGLYTVKGSVILSDSQFSDSDTQSNPSNVNSNDFLDSAQLIANESVVNGYLGVVDGSTDGIDFYKIQLASGDDVRVTYSGDAPEMSVMTFDGSNAVTVEVGASSGSQQLSATVATKQTFYIRVASTGTTQYILQTGNITVSFASRAEHKQEFSDFVPGEVIVKYKDAVIQRKSSGKVTPLNRPRLFAVSDFSSSIASRGVQGLSLKEQTLELVAELNRREDVEYAEVNNYYYPDSIPDDEYYGSLWNMHLVNASVAWDYQGNNDVVVAVIDSGIAKIADNGALRDHTDLEGKLVSGFDFIEDVDIANDGDGIDKDPADTGNTDFNSSFHGTHVAGIVVAKANNGIGVVGVAGASDNIKVMPIRVFGKDGLTTSYALSQAILFAAGELSDADEFVSDRTDNVGNHIFTPRAQVINMSLGGSSSDVVFDAVQKAKQAGVILVASAGNNASDAAFHYPSAYDDVISVAAQNQFGGLASYSNFGAAVDVSAPGGAGNSGTGQILSTYATGRVSIGVAESYEYSSGTSMSAPMVSGVIALMKSIDPTLTSDAVYTLIRSGNILDPVSNENMGYGSINALKAVSEVSGEGVVSPAPELRATPMTVNINYKQTQANILLYNGGTNSSANELVIDEFSSTSIDANVPENERWLLPFKTEENSLGVLNLFAVKGGVNDGIYTDTVTIESNVNTISIPVRMEINHELVQEVEDVTVSLFALKEDGSIPTDLVASTVAKKDDAGEYQYSFDSIAQGSYYLSAGSDTNGNDTSCDEGELCSVQSDIGSRTIHVGSGLRANISVITQSIDVP
ncbi:hypothetical protein A9Q81_24410 [Gammaproteobacteria bacterium 42_54_T18]|nr:hypothetical protein A9Q81_24410 [Gammaproteobacteria bacterium 42_54_T18]